MRLKKTLMTILLAALPLPAMAGHGSLDKERERHHRAIEKGIRSGALTRQEARVLQREQRELHYLERELRGDGKFKKWERRYLQSRYAELGRHVRDLKQNKATRKRHHHGERHDPYRYDYRYGYQDTDRDAGHKKGANDDEWLLWTGLGVMGVLLVDQLND